jgi:hypothetical protein
MIRIVQALARTEARNARDSFFAQSILAGTVKVPQVERVHLTLRMSADRARIKRLRAIINSN